MTARTLQVVPSAPPNPLARLVEDYLADVEARGRSRRTLAHYSSTLGRVFLAWCEREAITDATQLDQRALNRWTTELLSEGGARGPLSRDSVHSYTRVVNQFCVWAKSEGIKGVGKGHLPKLERKILDVLGREEIQRLENAARLERDKVVVRLLADSGIRLGELLGLRTSDLVEQGRQRLIRVRGKGAKERLVYVAPTLYRRLRRLAEGRPAEYPGDRLFISSRRRPGGGYSALEPRSVQEMLKELAHAAGIARRVYPHLLRHSFATHALRRGMNPLVLKDVLGHADLGQISGVYSHLTVDDQTAAMTRLLSSDED